MLQIIVNFLWLNGDVPRIPSYDIYISQLVRFAWCCNSVLDFNSKNLQIISKVLTQGYRYHKLWKTFGKLFRSYSELLSIFGEKSFQGYVSKGISHPFFYGDLVYGVFISQLIRYARASSSYECFILSAVRLSNKLLGQGYVKERLRSSLRKFYGRYGDLIKQYEVPLSRMLHDILDDGHLQRHPPLIRHNTNFWPYYWSWPYYRILLFT